MQEFPVKIVIDGDKCAEECTFFKYGTCLLFQENVLNSRCGECLNTYYEEDEK